MSHAWFGDPHRPLKKLTEAGQATAASGDDTRTAGKSDQNLLHTIGKHKQDGSVDADTQQAQNECLNAVACPSGTGTRPSSALNSITPAVLQQPSVRRHTTKHANGKAKQPNTTSKQPTIAIKRSPRVSPSPSVISGDEVRIGSMPVSSPHAAGLAVQQCLQPVLEPDPYLRLERINGYTGECANTSIIP